MTVRVREATLADVPAITALVTGQWPILLFVVAMLLGIKLACWLESRLA